MFDLKSAGVAQLGAKSRGVGSERGPNNIENEDAPPEICGGGRRSAQEKKCFLPTTGGWGPFMISDRPIRPYEDNSIRRFVSAQNVVHKGLGHITTALEATQTYGRNRSF